MNLLSSKKYLKLEDATKIASNKTNCSFQVLDARMFLYKVANVEKNQKNSNSLSYEYNFMDVTLVAVEQKNKTYIK